ncbi:flagellar protein FlaJ [Halogranum amylolyticum]|uniref:Flagellar protein FlaJ n=1 Tax=Halogranum amylolyticum TaxID=660520 RepID=A0A1H8P1M7_9EURY|nr:type II secretion system F family protein [Halogranum amylolyticum]SEO35846.1 flagellar protein FlaJ [Halogranum amylolyticum]
MLWSVPLGFVSVVCLVVVLDHIDDRVRLAVTRLGLALFGDYVETADGAERQRRRMHAAHVGVTHRVYASRTLLYSTLFGVVGSVLGVYLAAGVVSALSVSADEIRASLPAALSFLGDLATLPSLALGELFGLLLFASATVGTVLAVGSYWGRWLYLDQLAVARAGAIEATLPRTVAFVYALSRSGMSVPNVLATLVDNRTVYGAAADEVNVAVRDMDAFGTDVLTALRRVARRTPSEQLGEFAENLASVLSSGRNLSTFLHGQYERYQEEARAQQEQYLELLATFAEVYVTVLVAGPLFFITTLVVVGLVIQDTLGIVRFVSYVAIPLGTAGLVVYVDSVTPTPGSGDGRHFVDRPTDGARRFAPDGGAVSGTSTANEASTANHQRLRAYDRLRPLRRWFDDPWGTAFSRPTRSLALTVPLGLLWVVWRVDWSVRSSLARFDLAAVLDAVDEPLVQAMIFVLGVFALAYEVRKRRLRTMEAAVPDFLDRMASVNEAGVTVVQSLQRVARSDLGGLTPEVERAWRDVRWGADAETALRRMAARTSSPTVARAVTLVTNAMRATDDVAPVLRIAADEAQASWRLRRERRTEMVTYLLVIYISFFVFLGIVAALSVSFLPAVEATQTVGGGSATGSLPTGSVFGGIGDVDTDAYRLLFFHASVVQAVCSGLVAGQLGEESVADGVKHGVVLLVVAYAAFLVV